jgi:small subunit ribosomal protein S19e
MASVYDIYPNELIELTAERLKSVAEIKAPEWAVFAKTGVCKERPPMKTDWWFTRAAAILRSIYVMGPIGVNKLRTKYGGKQRRGHNMPHFKKGSGNVIRKCIQQLEKAGLIKNVEKGKHKGRIITGKGKSFLDKIAGEIAKTKPRPKIERAENIVEQITQPEQPAVTQTPPAKKPRAPRKKKADAVKEVPKEASSPETPKEAPKPEAQKVEQETE